MTDARLSEAPRLTAQGLALHTGPLPLWAGAVHYWRLDPASWKPCLQAVRSLGLRLIDVYIPWNVHETSKGRYDFGEQDPRKDLVRFLQLAQELDLYVIARPGPHINAELTYFGIPARVIWKKRCQAKSPQGHSVFLPAFPLGFPVPSYGAKAFFKQSQRYLKAVAKLLSPLCYPKGPIVLLQSDNEAALYFRDGAYDQDYHPDVIALYREFLEQKYGPVPPEPYGPAVKSFSDMLPPSRFDAARVEDLAWHLDWAEFQEKLIARFVRRTARRLSKAGFGTIPTTHNLAMGEHTTVVSLGSLDTSVDLLGLDYYYPIGTAHRRTIARRTSALALYCEARELPAFSCEQGAGFAPFMPPMTIEDNAFCLLCALAYGLRGFNLYMAVERDRWIGAPIDPQGNERPSAQFWQKLIAMLDRTGFAQLRRRTPVRLVTSRTQVRLGRVMNAFGPVTGAPFSLLGAGAKERCLETTLSTGEPLAYASEEFLTEVEKALEKAQIPFAHGSDDDVRGCLSGAQWVIVGCPGGAVSPAFLKALESFASEKGAVTFGPTAPSRDDRLRPLSPPADWTQWPKASQIPIECDASSEQIESMLAKAVDSFGLSPLECSSPDLFVTLHEDSHGVPKIAFLINAGPEPVQATLRIRGLLRAQEALEQEALEVSEETLKVRVAAGKVLVAEVFVRTESEAAHSA